jgi:hypothetical protein
MNENFEKEVTEALAAIIESVKYVYDEQTKIKKTVDTIVQVVTDAYEKDQEEADYNGFSEKASGLFDDDLVAKLKAIHGEDFDHTKALYDDVKSHRGDEGFDEDSYINEVIQEAAQRLAPITVNPVVQEIAETGEVEGEGGEADAEEAIESAEETAPEGEPETAPEGEPEGEPEEEEEEEVDWESVNPDKSFISKFGKID